MRPYHQDILEPEAPNSLRLQLTLPPNIAELIYQISEQTSQRPCDVAKRLIGIGVREELRHLQMRNS